MMNPDYLHFISRIEEFTRKYYLNQLIKGLIYSIFLLSMLFIFMNGIEYLAYFPKIVRLFLFYAFLLVFFFVLIKLIIIPALNLIRFRKAMPLENAARIIGKHFPEVNDKLLNTLQLHQLFETGQVTSLSLLEAGINKKINELSPVPFSGAVNLKGNLRFLRFAIVPLLLIIIALWLFPSFLTEPTRRIIAYNETFSKPLPYQIQILNDRLSVIQHENFTLEVTSVGKEFPAEIRIVINGFGYLMQKSDKNLFTFEFKNVQQDIPFKIESGPYSSDINYLKVLPKPVLTSFTALLSYPAYIGRSNETLRDVSILSVPAGTSIAWQFFTRNTDSLLLSTGDDSLSLFHQDGLFRYQMTALTDMVLYVKPVNNFVKESDPFQIIIEAIPDQYPDLAVSVVSEAREGRERFFTGLIQDDYGFTKLEFVYQIDNAELNETSPFFHFDVPVNKQRSRQEFYYLFSSDSINLQPGDRLNYYFEVWDNDRIHGPKSRKSQLFYYDVLSDMALDSMIMKQEKEKEESISNLLNDAKEVKKDVDDFLLKMMQKKEMDWNDKNQLKSIIEKQDRIENELKSLMEQSKDLQQMTKESKKTEERILDKQKKLDEMLNEVLNDELKELLEELRKLMDELDKEKIREMLNELKMNNETLERMLDRNLSLLKQLQFEKDMQQLADQLNKLAEELLKEVDKELNSREDQSESMTKLDSISKEFDQFSETLDSLRSRNEKLDKPFDIEDTDEQELDIKNDLNSAKSSQEKGSSQKAKQSKSSASGKMSKLSMELKKMMQQEGEKRKAEDAATLRILLENILRASHSQESLLHHLSVIKRDDPAYSEIIREQSQMRESFGIIEDSLIALGKRQPEIESFVYDEMDKVKSKMNSALENMKERRSSNSLSDQQFAMMSLNNLSLMLSEALRKMQESMGMPNPMQGENDNSDGQNGSESLSNMKEVQEGLGKQLKESIKKMESKGQEGGEGSQSEEIARMAAQQEALRNQMQSLMEQFKQNGLNGDGLNEIMQEMEKIEEDLVNKRLDGGLIKRNEDLVVRLLKAEKAEREREMKEERESKTPKDQLLSNPGGILEYKEMIKRQEDALKLLPIEVKPYYRKRIAEYLLQTNELRKE
jgi:hypothetical protein